MCIPPGIFGYGLFSCVLSHQCHFGNPIKAIHSSHLVGVLSLLCFVGCKECQPWFQNLPRDKSGIAYGKPFMQVLSYKYLDPLTRQFSQLISERKWRKLLVRKMIATNLAYRQRWRTKEFIQTIYNASQWETAWLDKKNWQINARSLAQTTRR